jgi:hypothetical protein
VELYFCSLHMPLWCVQGQLHGLHDGIVLNIPVFWGVTSCRWATFRGVVLPSSPGLPQFGAPDKDAIPSHFLYNPQHDGIIILPSEVRYWGHIPHDVNPQQHRCENLKPHKDYFIVRLLRWHALVKQCWGLKLYICKQYC